MKEGLIIKSFSATQDDLSLINKLTRREFKMDEIYAFSVLLCDNEIDRDFERFTIPALEKLAELYIGKTGIFDHNPKGENQTARIFKTYIEKNNEQETAAGEPYTALMAGAYMVKSAKNADLILDLDAGIKKEVSVGCAVAAAVCSVCGTNLKAERCKHTKGRKYAGKVCHTVLDMPTDAYEWSFVAVPAQRNAGVKKHFFENSVKEDIMEIIEKIMSVPEPLQLNEQQVESLKSYIHELKTKARLGAEYHDQLKKDFVRLSFLCQPGLSSEITAQTADNMTIEQLKAYNDVYEKQTIKQTKPQLAVSKPALQPKADKNYFI